MNADSISHTPRSFGVSVRTPVSGEAPINILIVDDEPKNLTVLETILDDPGYRLVRAESADQALLALVAEEFALLILDIRMPGMTGLELAQMIKERKKTARVPIIFLTAYYNEDQHVIEGYDTGAVDYLHKPVVPAILRSKVAVFAELHRKTRELTLANRAMQTEVAERRLVEEQLRELNETLERRVTERTEALREADGRKDEFLAMLAHELRNPLAPVWNAVQLLRMQGPATPELQWIRDVIDRQVQQMTRLIDDLMDVSRISRGKVELRKQQVELAKVVQGAIETSRPLIEEYGHELTVSLPSEPIVLDADGTRLTQVILNLLNNAAKFTENGGCIALAVERQHRDVIVTVKDTGIGIPTEKLASVFEMFSQVGGVSSASHGGLGIGLCLVKRLVELHGGSIEAKSAGLGQGSEFVVRLPNIIEQVGSRTGGDDGDHPSPTSALRILVVDDNQDAATSLAMLLELMGNTVILAYDGEQAVSAAREFNPDVVLLDIGMPKVDGYAAARAIRKEPCGERAVLIAVTGWGQDGDRRKTQEAGFDRHMVKPVEPQALMALLAELRMVKA